MAHGFEVYRADGSLLISSDDIGGLFIDVLPVTTNGSLTKGYSALAGKTIAASAEQGGDVENGRVAITITYPGGVPTIQINNTSGASSSTTVIVE